MVPVYGLRAQRGWSLIQDILECVLVTFFEFNYQYKINLKIIKLIPASHKV